MATPVFSILFIVIAVPVTLGQFPAVCNTPESLDSKTCCPNNCNSPNGVCFNVTSIVNKSWDAADQAVFSILRDGPPDENWPLDVRYLWPTQVYESVCKCIPGRGGYDCSSCDFGYFKNNEGECVKRDDSNSYVRQNFSKLVDAKKAEYISVIKAAKAEEGEWAVVVGEPTRDEPSGSFELQNVTTYDMLIMLHTLSAREKRCKFLNSTFIDFAHRNSTFSTWHRYYLLQLERELRRIAEGMGIEDFTLPYWTWVDDSENVFREDLFGTPLSAASTTEVSGELFENDWPVICDYQYRTTRDGNLPGDCSSLRTLCNANEDRSHNRRLKRGDIVEDPLIIMGNNTQPYLPREDTIEMALAARDNNVDTGFLKRLEGFVDLCPGNPKGACLSPKPNLSDSLNNLHNTVHIFIGGHMRNVPSATNDPIFFLHHANVDRLFEIWLRSFDPDEIPVQSTTEGRHPGHNKDDYLVPLFPLKTNADMYRVSTELGYTYDKLPEDLVPDTDFPLCPSEYNVCNRESPDPTSEPTSGAQQLLYCAALVVFIAASFVVI